MSKNPTTVTDWKAEAEIFFSAGLRVIPFWVSETGAMGMPKNWRYFNDCDLEELRADSFWAKYGAIATGLALMMTGDLEAIDVDHKADPTGTIRTDYLQAVKEMGGEDVISKCIAVKTKSNGLHFVYRAANREGNQKLAARAKEVDGQVRPETLVETRGEGGLLFVSPTPGYSLIGPHYNYVQTLTDEERNILIQAGRACDRMPEQQPVSIKEKREAFKEIPKGEGVTPWDAFNEATDALDMMESLGWTVVNKSGDYIRLNRPGHKNNQQASGSVMTRFNMFWPFTTSTVFEADRGYSPFAIYAYSVHGGNFSAAAKALYADGFGDRRGSVASQKLDGSRESLESAVEKVLADTSDAKPVDGADELSQLLAEVDNDHTFSVSDELEDVDYCMYHIDPLTGKEIGISAMGMFGLMVGLQKSGKTTLLTAFVVAALTNEPFLTFRFDLKGRSILWLDCEQPKYWFQLVCRRVYRLAGLKEDSPRLRAVSLRRYSKAQRAAITGALILREKNLGLGVIDGLVDICQNFNDVEQSELTIDKVLEWSDRSGALLMGVIHLTKGLGYIKGHLGTIAQNKCDFALECAKTEDNGRFKVIHREARGVAIEPFEFYRDENGDPVTPEQHESQLVNEIAKTRSKERDEPERPRPLYAEGRQMQMVSEVDTNQDVPF